MVDNDVCTPYTTSQSVAYMYDPKLPHLMNVFIVLTLYHGKYMRFSSYIPSCVFW